MLTSTYVPNCVLLLALAGCSVTPHEAVWPRAGALSTEPLTADGARVAEQPVCIGARSWSAGSLGDTVLYRTRRVGHKLAVGYFIYWSEERPWGSNAVSFAVLPALATDAVYSHFLWLFPGLKDALYGPGDIEGVQVEYEQEVDGSLRVLGGLADNGSHTPVQLSAADLVDAKGRVVLLTDVWSHQLGAHGAAEFSNTRGSELKCYAKTQLLPLSSRVARTFRLGSEHKPLRGVPAWLEPALPSQGLPPEQMAAAKGSPSHQ